MKILILLKKWPGGVGGGIKNISKELRKLGHQIDIISREEDLKYFSLISSFFPIRNKIINLMKRNNYDIIYTQDWTLAAPLLFPYPLYFNRHYSMFHGNQFGLIKIFQNTIGFLMRKHLLVMAPSLKRRFPNANINYCGVSINQFKPLKLKRKYLGWTQKGTEVITLETIKTLSLKLNLPLLIAKNLPHEEMNKFYNQCKIFISLPPKEAGFQASWLEAMMAGVPTIIGNINGAGELQPFDKVNLGEENNIDHLMSIIKNSKKINYISWVKDNDFSWKRHAKKLIEIFTQK